MDGIENLHALGGIGPGVGGGVGGGGGGGLEIFQSSIQIISLKNPKK